MKLGWVGLSVLLAAAGVSAQETADVYVTAPAAPPADTAQAPVRAARLTFLQGGLQVQRADNTSELSPVVNMPLNQGARLTTGDYGQAEVEFEDGSVVRMVPRTTLTLDKLSIDGGKGVTNLSLQAGMAYFELRKSDMVKYKLTAGEAAMTPVENSVVRVMYQDSPAVFSVLSGAVRVQQAVDDDGFRAKVLAGESLRADAQDVSRYFLNDQVEQESWDSWNANRDADANSMAQARTGARDGAAGVQGYGWSDLDASGKWYDVAGEGQVWQPDGADDSFDPYDNGNWVWSNVGYVWASGYGWGWTPYRCGRWAYYPGFGWGWRADAGCGTWGSAGGEILVGDRRPGGYKIVRRPLSGPGRTHPIVPIKWGPAPTPPRAFEGRRTIAGVEVKPLPRVGTGSVAGGALAADYPVDRKTGKAVAGITSVKAPEVGVAAPRIGWRPVVVDRKPTEEERKAAVVRSAAGRVEANREYTLPSQVAPAHREPVQTNAAPATVRSAPVQAPPPVRAAPVQAPAPVRAAPPAAAPAPAAPKSDTAKPK